MKTRPGRGPVLAPVTPATQQMYRGGPGPLQRPAGASAVVQSQIPWTIRRENRSGVPPRGAPGPLGGAAPAAGPAPVPGSGFGGFHGLSAPAEALERLRGTFTGGGGAAAGGLPIRPDGMQRAEAVPSVAGVGTGPHDPDPYRRGR